MLKSYHPVCVYEIECPAHDYYRDGARHRVDTVDGDVFLFYTTDEDEVFAWMELHGMQMVEVEEMDRLREKLAIANPDKYKLSEGFYGDDHGYSPPGEDDNDPDDLPYQY